jgi:glycosyltransferase involved in cell wall biosynthesis
LSLVIVPTYNEADNIAALAPRILANGDDVHLLVVDDNSPDGTGALADQLANREARVHVLHRPGKLGLGSAYRSGFDYALANGFERVITMDADFSHPPERIAAIIEAAEVQPVDLVIGSRYAPGGEVVDSPQARRFISRGANLLATRTLGLRARDCTAGFRCYRRRVLETVDFHEVRSNGYSCLIEMLYRCQQAGFVVAEVPITFRDRAKGASKISRREILGAFVTLARLNKERLLARQPRFAE